MAKYLFVDGNNLGVRAAFAHHDLHIDLIDFDGDFNPDDAMDADKRFPTGVLFGFTKSLMAIRRNNPEHFITIVWDGGHKRRTEESKVGVEKGIIPEAYKENRRTGKVPQAVLDFHKQKKPLQEMLAKTNIPQIVAEGEEADDVIASYVTKYATEENDLILHTNDKDYYQLLTPGVSILSKSETLSSSWFSSTYGITPIQWVDVGAMQGDDGDNIFGVPGWGEATALDHIKQFGSSEGVLKHFHEIYDHLRGKYPDLKGDDFKALKNMKTEKKGLPKYPHIAEWMPFTGVALALENKDIKMPKVALTALIYESRVTLAKVLKKMHTDISLPALPCWDRNKAEEFVTICRRYRLNEIEPFAAVLCGQQKKFEKEVDRI